MEAIEFVKSMEVLEMKPGDVVAFKIDRKISPVIHQQLRAAIKHTFMEVRGCEDVGVLIIEPGFDIGILRESDKRN